jgi:hypothetical protein
VILLLVLLFLSGHVVLPITGAVNGRHFKMANPDITNNNYKRIAVAHLGVTGGQRFMFDAFRDLGYTKRPTTVCKGIEELALWNVHGYITKRQYDRAARIDGAEEFSLTMEGKLIVFAGLHVQVFDLDGKVWLEYRMRSAEEIMHLSLMGKGFGVIM